MQSNNPLFKKASFIPSAEPMSINGAINKTVVMTGTAATVAVL